MPKRESSVNIWDCRSADPAGGAANVANVWLDPYGQEMLVECAVKTDAPVVKLQPEKQTGQMQVMSAQWELNDQGLSPGSLDGSSC